MPFAICNLLLSVIYGLWTINCWSGATVSPVFKADGLSFQTPNSQLQTSNSQLLNLCNTNMVYILNRENYLYSFAIRHLPFAICCLCACCCLRLSSVIFRLLSFVCYLWTMDCRLWTKSVFSFNFVPLCLDAFVPFLLPFAICHSQSVVFVFVSSVVSRLLSVVCCLYLCLSSFRLSSLVRRLYLWTIDCGLWTIRCL